MNPYLVVVLVAVAALVGVWKVLKWLDDSNRWKLQLTTATVQSNAERIREFFLGSKKKQWLVQEIRREADDLLKLLAPIKGPAAASLRNLAGDAYFSGKLPDVPDLSDMEYYRRVSEVNQICIGLQAMAQAA